MKHTQPTISLERVLMLPVIDRILGRALCHPRLLQWFGTLIGLLIIGLALRPLLVSSTGGTSMAEPVQASGHAVLQASTTDGDTEQRTMSAEQSELVATVAAYNQASITAALLGRAEAMAPYLAPDGTAWAEVQAEYERRSTRREIHEATLTRWGVLQMEITGGDARLETQEQWDDIVSVGGQVISSRRGILTHNTYELRCSATSGRWQITTVTSVTVID